MSETPDGSGSNRRLGLALAGLAAGAACLAVGCWLRARDAGRPKVRVPEERIREAVPAREPRALAYTRTRYLTLLAGEALSFFFLAAVMSAGRPIRLRAWAGRVAGQPLLRDALFGGALLTLYTAVALPLSFLSGFVIEHAYGLSTQSAGSWAADAAKGLAVSLVLTGPSVAGLYAIIRRSPQRWWLWAGGAWALLAVVLANVAPILIDPLFHRYTPLADEDLRRRLVSLAERVGQPVLGVYTADYSRKTKKANAYLTGVGGTRRIVLTDTLLAGYTHDEIASVLAHELGHHHFGHIRMSILLGLAGTLAGFALADRTLARAGAQPGFEGKGDVATLPALAMFLNVVGLLAMPAGSALSRAWERQCDRFAIEQTGNPRAFIGVMRKLGEQNLSDPAPPAAIELLLYDHPSVRNRILMALEWEA